MAGSRRQMGVLLLRRMNFFVAEMTDQSREVQASDAYSSSFYLRCFHMIVVAGIVDDTFSATSVLVLL